MNTFRFQNEFASYMVHFELIGVGAGPDSVPQTFNGLSNNNFLLYTSQKLHHLSFRCPI